MTTPEEELELKSRQFLKEKLSKMTIEELTQDQGLIRVFRNFEKETGGNVEDFVRLSDKSNLQNWTSSTERRLEMTLARLKARVDAHLSEPNMDQPIGDLPPLDEELVLHLRNIGMDAISSDVRMNNCYDRSGALSLYAFAYKTNRFPLRNWGTKSERLFQEELHRYVAIPRPTEAQPAGQSARIGLEQEMSSFMSYDDDKLRHFYNKNFAQIKEAIRKQARGHLMMSQIASEMNLRWPYSHRNRLLSEYLCDDKSRIFKTAGLGKKKIRMIILCLIWAAKGCRRNMDKFSKMSPNELMRASPLSANEKQALTLRFLGEEPMTLAEAARNMDVTRERVRQHQKTAENKLRNLGINQFARDWLRRNSSKIWAMLSDDDGATVVPKQLPGGYRRCVPGEVLLATVLAGWSVDDVLSLEGDPIDDWWVKKAKD